MVDFFSNTYDLTIPKSKLLDKLRFYTFFRVIIRISANIIIPLYFILTRYNSKYSILNDNSKSPKVIISLTSFPDRINRVWLVIESLLRQNEKPDRIILWLSKDQFENFDKLPKSLIHLQNRGLEIRLCDDDLRSHKKYFYAMQEFRADFILTVDDDVFYHSELIKNLVRLNKRYPKAICCNCVSKIEIKNGDIVPYLSWSDVFSEQKPSAELMPIGVGGVLYPPNSMSIEVFNVEVFKETCFLADDIWLNIMARLHRTQVAKTNYDSFYLPVMNKNNMTLNSINNIEGQNDVQINAVRNYCLSKLKIDPFQSVISLYK